MPDESPDHPPLPANLDPRRPPRRGRPTRRAGSRHSRSTPGGRLRFKKLSLYSGMGLATLLSVGLLVTTGISWWQYRQFDTSITRVQIGAVQSADPGIRKDIDGKDQNILIVANDDRSGLTANELHQLSTTNEPPSLNTDSMMIIHVPADGSKATLISLPRDSYVRIPGYGMNKLNAAYPDGFNAATGNHKQRVAAGMNLLIETIHNLIGLYIDHFAMVNLIGFYRISNAIGGVRVNVCESITDKDSGAHFHKGWNTVRGLTAVAFVRQRYGYPQGLGDLDRVKRQQYFLTATFRQVFSGNVLSKMEKVLGAVRSSVTIDSGLDPLTLGSQMADLSANNIISETIPYVTFTTVAPFGDVNIVDPAAVKTSVLQWIGQTDPKLKTALPVAPSTVTVSVLNAGTGQNGAAAKNAGVLQAQGFHLGQVSDSPYPVTATTIEYPDGMQSQAKTLAQYVPNAFLLKVSSVKAVTLLLGPDGLSAKRLPTSTPSNSTSPTIPSKSPSSSLSPSPSPSPSKAKPIDATCVQ